MTARAARNRIYGLWGGTLVALILVFQFGPSARPGVVSPVDAHAALMKTSALFVPVLTAFATFWFRPGSGTGGATRVSKERVTAAIATTVAYQLLFLASIARLVFFKDYDKVEPDESFNDAIGDIIQLHLYLFPVATAPIAYLLGVEAVVTTERRQP